MKNEKGQFLKGNIMSEEDKNKISETMQGNLNAVKIKDSDLQKVAYENYCTWIASGKSQRGWVFDYKDEKGKKKFITWQTIERYIELFPSVCPPENKQRAENMGYQAWENTGIEMMIGKIEKCQPAIYQMMMRNKFGWDKESKVTHTHEPDARKFMKYCEEKTVE